MANDDRFSGDVAAQMRDRARGRRSAVMDGPVADWTTDWSHLDPVWAADPYSILDTLRDTCPIAHTERFGGAWLPTKYDDIAAIAYDTDHFSSRSVVIANIRPPVEVAPAGVIPPISSDPPFHHGARKLLLPAFTKKAALAMAADTRAYCHALLDQVGEAELVDAAADYAQHIPMRVIADLLGFPPGDAPAYREFVEGVLEGANLEVEERLARMGRLYEYLQQQIDAHLAEPRDDLTTYLLNVELDGDKLDAFNVRGMMALLLIAGIDTTWSAIGASLWHLAKTPADRERLVAEPELLPSALEELLRFYAPVTMARLVKNDITWGGVAMKAEDWVLLSFPSANRDSSRFDRADEVVIDREVNRHAAFGLGIHRCVGSHLARMELRVALEVWLERFPSFSLADPNAVTWAAGQVRGPRALPIRINR